VAKKKWVRPSSDRILAAAEAVFARHGYGETSLRQLMSAAGVSTTAFYARFPSKEAVLQALVTRLLSDLREHAQAEIGAAEGLEEGFRGGVDVLCDVLTPRRALLRIALTEAYASPQITETLGGLYAGLASLLTARIEKLMAAGGVAAVDASAVGWGIVGALNMQVLRWAVYDQLPTTGLRAQLHAVADSFLPVLLPASGRRRPRRRSPARASTASVPLSGRGTPAPASSRSARSRGT
jgi:AcrR family transcriptional regulator